MRGQAKENVVWWLIVVGKRHEPEPRLTWSQPGPGWIEIDQAQTNPADQDLKIARAEDFKLHEVKEDRPMPDSEDV